MSYMGCGGVGCYYLPKVEYRTTRNKPCQRVPTHSMAGFLFYLKRRDNMKLKIGDKVKCIKAYDGKKEAVGKNGTVIAHNGYIICVQFDKNINGHNGNGYGSGKKGIVGIFLLKI